MTDSSSISLATLILDLPSRGLSRIGTQIARKLALGLARVSTGRDISTVNVEDLLHYLPMRYEDRSSLATIRDLTDDTEASLELFVKIAGGYQVRSKRSFSRSLYIFEISATDRERSGRDVVVWTFLSGPHAQKIIENYAKKFSRGARFIVFGKWEWDKRRQTYSLRLNKPDEIETLPAVTEPRAVATGQVSAPRAVATGSSGEPNDDPTLAAIHVGRRVPVYRKVSDLRPKQLREIIHALLKVIPNAAIAETLPDELRKRYRLPSRAEALRQIHFPSEEASLSDYERARSPAHRRLIFEELFWLALGLLVKRGIRRKESKSAKIKIDDPIKRRIASVLPFKLTEAQRKVVKEIFADMRSDAPMNRLLQGDVGSGKTIVALIAMLAAMENNYQAALMVPTEILAEQHARNIKRLLAKTPYRVELLIGSLRATEKRRLHNDLATGDIQAAIGTHALIQESVSFHKLGLVVIDEQHRFGVLQRAEIRSRGFNPDVLVMTATPIPRSLAMTAYGDLDVSVIDELPPGRTPIKTVVVGEDQRAGVYKGVEREVRTGRQVYVVYPLIEESEKMDLKDATRMYEQLRDRVFPHFSIGLLHGKMKTAEKEEVMRRFVAGEIQVLVATTVIEVGVDVPNASLMLIEHAERFGLSQLHQLRGRVGRGAEQSYCVLLASDKKTS